MERLSGLNEKIYVKYLVQSSHSVSVILFPLPYPWPLLINEKAKSTKVGMSKPSDQTSKALAPNTWRSITLSNSFAVKMFIFSSVDPSADIICFYGGSFCIVVKSLISGVVESRARLWIHNYVGNLFRVLKANFPQMCYRIWIFPTPLELLSWLMS